MENKKQLKVLKIASDALKLSGGKWKALFFIAFLSTGASAFLSGVPYLTEVVDLNVWTIGIIYFAFWIISVAFYLIFIVNTFDVVNGKVGGELDVLSRFPLRSYIRAILSVLVWIGAYLFAGFVLFLVTLIAPTMMPIIGFILLLASVYFSLAFYFNINEIFFYEKGVFESFKNSYHLTKGIKIKMVLGGLLFVTMILLVSLVLLIVFGVIVAAIYYTLRNSSGLTELFYLAGLPIGGIIASIVSTVYAVYFMAGNFIAYKDLREQTFGTDQ